MQSLAGQGLSSKDVTTIHCRAQQLYHAWHGELIHATYGQPVGLDEEVAKERFRRFVARALEDARVRGLSDPQVREATGVGISTFYRWRRIGWDKERPKLAQVEAFCSGLGIPVSVAMAALGADPRGSAASTEPEPAIDPDIRTILRKLADPNVPDAEKWLIRETIRGLAQRPTPADPPHRRISG